MATTRGVRRYLALRPGDWALAARAYAAIWRIEGLLRRSGFQATVRSVQSPGRSGWRAPTGDDLHRARRYARWIAAVARRHRVRARCLHRSLVLHRWLRREGLPSVLRIGVRKEGAELRAHAWVELGGEVVNDLPASIAPFTPLARGDGDPDAALVAFAGRLATADAWEG